MSEFVMASREIEDGVKYTERHKDGAVYVSADDVADDVDAALEAADDAQVSRHCGDLFGDPEDYL